MNTVRNIVVTLTLATVGLSGVALAAEKGNRKGMRGEGVRVEQRTERRANRERVAVRENRRNHDRQAARSDNYGRVDRRQDKQRARIKNGRRSGELNRGETRRLKKQQRKIGRMERRFSSDGHLSGKERRRLEHAQDRASKRIARMKHNDIYRGSGGRYANSYKSRRAAYGRYWRH